MTRKRQFNPHSNYHVIMRGNNRQPILSTQEDMFELLRAFQHVHNQFIYYSRILLHDEAVPHLDQIYERSSW